MLLSIICFTMLNDVVVGINCQQLPIYQQIIKNSPRIDREYAMELSALIHKYSIKYKIPPHIYTAILMQESSYRLHVKWCTTQSVKVNGTWQKQRVCKDFGISQIHYKTARSYGFDKEKLVTDLKYSVKAGAIVLSDFKEMYKLKELDWWTRYNTSNREKRDIYKKRVKRYF